MSSSVTPLDLISATAAATESSMPALSGTPRSLSKRADAVLLFGQVRELEIEAEGADQDLRLLHVDVDQICSQWLARRSAGATPQPDRRAPDALNEIECVRALLLDDDLAEQRPQQLDLASQAGRGP